jgi:hypothetical protein
VEQAASRESLCDAMASSDQAPKTALLRFCFLETKEEEEEEEEEEGKKDK